jgi:hypothetical protein
MSTSNVSTDVGGVTDMGRLMPLLDWEPSNGAVVNGGVVYGTSVTPAGIGNQIIIFPYWNLEALQAGPVLTDIKNFELYIRYTFYDNAFIRSAYKQGANLTDDYPELVETQVQFTPADIQPGPNARVAGATLGKVAYEGWSLPDRRTDDWPPSEAAVAAIRPLTFPCFHTVSLGEVMQLVVVVNSLGGPGVVPIKREGEYLKVLASIGGLARTL